MSKLAVAALILVAALHVYFANIEMFAWQAKGGSIMPTLTAEILEKTKAMAANQGLYNLFIAAGLIWAGLKRDRAIALFFLACVVIAGAFGGLTIQPKIFFVQAIPALLAIGAIFWSTRPS